MGPVPIRTLPLGGSEPSDAELVSRARQQDAWAERALYRRHAPRLLRAARRILGNDADALDVVQEAFLRVFRRLGQLLDGSAFAAFLMRTGVRLAVRKLRWRAVTGRLFLGGEDPGLLLDPQPEVSLETKQTLKEVEAVVRRLPAQERAAFVLRYVEGYELTEVAAACGVSLATIKRQLASAQRRVQQQVARWEGGEP